MRTDEHNRRWYVLCLIAGLLLSAFGLTGCAKQYPPPKAVNGVLDLSMWDFENQGSISLSGQWEFYWKNLIIPGDFLSRSHPEKTGFFPLPGTWNGYVISGSPIGPDGYATFRLQVKMPDVNRIKSRGAAKLSGKRTVSGQNSGEPYKNGTKGAIPKIYIR